MFILFFLFFNLCVQGCYPRAPAAAWWCCKWQRPPASSPGPPPPASGNSPTTNTRAWSTSAAAGLLSSPCHQTTPRYKRCPTASILGKDNRSKTKPLFRQWLTCNFICVPSSEKTVFITCIEVVLWFWEDLISSVVLTFNNNFQVSLN